MTSHSYEQRILTTDANWNIGGQPVSAELGKATIGCALAE